MSVKNRIQSKPIKNISLESIDSFNLKTINISNETISESVKNFIKHLKDMLNKLISLFKEFVNSIILKFKHDKYDPKKLKEIPNNYKAGVSFKNDRLAKYFCIEKNGKLDTPDINVKYLDFCLGNVTGGYLNNPERTLEEIIHELSVYDLNDSPTFNRASKTNLRIISLGGFDMTDNSLMYEKELAGNIFVDVRPSGARNNCRDGMPGNKLVKKEYQFNQDGLIINHHLSYIDLYPNIQQVEEFQNFETPTLDELKHIRDRVETSLEGIKYGDFITFPKRTILEAEIFFDQFSKLVEQKELTTVTKNYCLLFMKTITSSMNIYAQVKRMHMELIEHRLDLYNACIEA